MPPQAEQLCLRTPDVDINTHPLEIGTRTHCHTGAKPKRTTKAVIWKIKGELPEEAIRTMWG